MVLSETVINAFMIVIVFFLLIIIANSIVFNKTTDTYQEVYESLANEISINIDRASASTSSSMVDIAIPKGLKYNLTIDYKAVIISAMDASAIRHFSADLNKTFYFENPENLCIVKSEIDSRIFIIGRACICNTADNICNPECIVTGVCDDKCHNVSPDGVCNMFCASKVKGICDPDCNGFIGCD